MAKTVNLINNTRPPEVKIDGKPYQFKSLLELRFALLMEMQRIAGEIEQWQYEPTKIQFPGRKKRPHEYTPDFVTIAGEETTIYEGMAFLTTEYMSKFRCLKRLKISWKVVIIMDKPDTVVKRKQLYEKAVKNGLVDHIWYVGADFKKLGILDAASALCFAAGAEAASETEPATTPVPQFATNVVPDDTAEDSPEPAAPLAFQKIASIGKVKDYKRSLKGVDVSFKDLHFGDGHRELLDYWIDEKVKLRVTIEEYEQVRPREKPAEASLFESPEPGSQAAVAHIEEPAEPTYSAEPASGPNDETFMVALPDEYNAGIWIFLATDADGLWTASYLIKIPGAEFLSPASAPHATKVRALNWANGEIGVWLMNQVDYPHRAACEMAVNGQVSDWVATLLEPEAESLLEEPNEP